MLFAVCSDRGAPGSSTVARVLASARGLPAVVVGADPYGDDMALRVRPDGKYPMPDKPTVLGIGAGQSGHEISRRGPRVPGLGPTYNDVWHEGSHELSPLVRVVPGFMSAEAGASTAWLVLAEALKAQSTAVFADLGRIHTGSPSMPLAAAADVIIPVCRGDRVSVHTMTARVELLVDAFLERNQRPPLVFPVVIANRKHGDALAEMVAMVMADSEAAAAVCGVAWLAWDPVGVNVLDEGGDPWSKPLRKSPLMRSARKAMRWLGVTTGLDHAEPNVQNKRGRAAAQPSHHTMPPQMPPQMWPPPNSAPPGGALEGGGYQNSAGLGRRHVPMREER